MPLTIAHPAAVLPLRRSRLPFSALIAGSLSPDLEYLFRLSPRGTIGHTLPGLFYFCIPASLFTLWLVHRIWRAPLMSIFPEIPGSKPFEFLPPSRLLLICAAAGLGALTHLAWDSITHSHGWVVQHAPELNSPIFETSQGTLRPYKLLQHGSTALGIMILSMAARRHAAWAINMSKSGQTAIFSLFLISAALGAIFSLFQNGIPPDFDTMRASVGVTIVSSASFAVGGVTLFCLGWHAKKRRSLAVFEI